MNLNKNKVQVAEEVARERGQTSETSPPGASVVRLEELKSDDIQVRWHLSWHIWVQDST